MDIKITLTLSCKQLLDGQPENQYVKKKKIEMLLNVCENGFKETCVTRGLQLRVCVLDSEEL